MGNPKFYFFPEPDGSQLVEIDLGEGLAEFFFDFEVERSTAIALDGGMYRTTTTHRQILNIQRDRFTGGEDLAIKFAALQNHLDRGYSCAFAVDSDRAWCYPVVNFPQGGVSEFQVGGDPFRGIVGNFTPLANDYCNIISQNPDLVFEQNKIDSTFSSVGWASGQGGILPLENPTAFTYNKPAFIHHHRYFPLLKRPNQDIGQNIITNESGRLFSLSLRLVIDTAQLFSFHPQVDSSAGQSNNWVGDFVLGGQVAGMTLDRSSSGQGPTVYNPHSAVRARRPWWN